MITALPPAPLPTDSPVNFNTKSFNLVAALSNFVTDANILQVDVNNKATIATTQAALAATNGATQVALAEEQVSLAAEQVTLATASATAAAGSALVAGAVAWVSGTTYAAGDTRYSPINLQTYRRISAGSGTTDPSLDATNWALAINAGISNVVTATGMTTLTSTPTLLQITPASYGVTVTLPDATTCKLGGPLHIIDNRGVYPVRVCNASGVLKGFIFAGVVSHVSLSDNSTTAGVWAIENSELVGVSAQLTSPNFFSLYAACDLGTNREFILGRGTSTANLYGVVYNRATNVFGSATLIRTAAQGNQTATAIVSATDQVLVCSVTTNSTAFEAVTLTISGTSITVNTAAAATLSANADNTPFQNRDVIAVGSSFVCIYPVDTPAVQLRALSISGTTVTIGAASSPTGTADGHILASSSVVVVASRVSTGTLYVTPYTVSGSTLTLGTGASVTPGWNPTQGAAFFALGTRFVYYYYDANGTGGARASIASLSGTTITLSTATLFSSSTYADAIILSSTKVLFLCPKTSLNANILTDTGGTASAGTAITLSGATSRGCLSVSGTDAYVWDTPASVINYIKLDCSGASPVMTIKQPSATPNTLANGFPASSTLLVKASTMIVGTGFVQGLGSSTAYCRRTYGDTQTVVAPNAPLFLSPSIQGINNAERWGQDGSSLIYKVEAA